MIEMVDVFLDVLEEQNQEWDIFEDNSEDDHCNDCVHSNCNGDGTVYCNVYNEKIHLTKRANVCNELQLKGSK